jgi:hypothetical protein
MTGGKSSFGHDRGTPHLGIGCEIETPDAAQLFTVGLREPDQGIVFKERHLRRILSSHFQYHHEVRTHVSVNNDCD